MRLSAINVKAQVWSESKPVRPIQLRLGATRYSMDVDEAVGLARQLVRAVDALSGIGVDGGDE